MTTLSDTDRAEFIAGLPKCEMHVHLEGTLSPELKLRLAQRNGIAIGQSTVEEVEASYQFDSLTTFLAVYYPAMAVLVTEEDFADLVMDYLRRAKADNVRRAEMFFDPQAHTSRGVHFDTVVNGYLAGVQRGRDELGISADLIMCFLRDMSAESAMATLEAAMPFKDRIIAVGLDSDERGNPPEKFAEVYARAREAGFHLTMHCDIDQPGSIDNIRTALHVIGVERLDHGTNIVEDPSLVAFVRDRGIGLTCCPISNAFVTDKMKSGEIIELLHDGVRVTVNSDDPAYFGGYVTANFVALADDAALDLDDLVLLARNSFEIAWISDEERAGHLAAVDDHVQAWNASRSRTE